MRNLHLVKPIRQVYSQMDGVSFFLQVTRRTLFPSLVDLRSSPLRSGSCEARVQHRSGRLAVWFTLDPKSTTFAHRDGADFVLWPKVLDMGARSEPPRERLRERKLMPLHRDRRATPPRRKSGPPALRVVQRSALSEQVKQPPGLFQPCRGHGGLPHSSHGLLGQPARASPRSYPAPSAERSRCANVVDFGSSDPRHANPTTISFQQRSRTLSTHSERSQMG
jgi:hypothetical protein